MTITGDDVRRARGKESRKSFSERVGITEAKIAGIEKGRPIRPDEFEKLTPFVTPSDGTVPVYEPPKPRSTPRPRKAAAATKTAAADIKKNERSPDVVLIDDDEMEDLGEDEAWTLLGVEPQAPEPQATPRELVPEGARLISNSEVQTFKRCKRKHYLAFIRGLRPKAGRHTGAMPMGTRAHAALAAWYVPEGHPKTDPRDALERVLVEDWTRIESGFASDDENRELRLQTLATEFKKDADMLRAVIEGYVQWIAETGADEDLEVVAPEAPMAARFPITTTETPVYITGRMDVRLRRRSDGARLFMDHKTVGDFTSPTRVLNMNPQMKHYHLLEILDMLKDRVEAGDGVHYEVERTDGALYNMLRKVKRSVQAKPPFYQRVEVRHNKHEIASYERELRGVIEDMLSTQARIAAGYDTTVVAYPRPDESCAWSCDFFPVCPMMDDGSRAEQFIEEIYEKHDPYDRYPEFT